MTRGVEPPQKKARREEAAPAVVDVADDRAEYEDDDYSPPSPARKNDASRNAEYDDESDECYAYKESAEYAHDDNDDAESLSRPHQHSNQDDDDDDGGRRYYDDEEETALPATSHFFGDDDDDAARQQDDDEDDADDVDYPHQVSETCDAVRANFFELCRVAHAPTPRYSKWREESVKTLEDALQLTLPEDLRMLWCFSNAHLTYVLGTVDEAVEHCLKTEETQNLFSTYKLIPIQLPIEPSQNCVLDHATGHILSVEDAYTGTGCTIAPVSPSLAEYLEKAVAIATRLAADPVYKDADPLDFCQKVYQEYQATPAAFAPRTKHIEQFHRAWTAGDEECDA